MELAPSTWTEVDAEPPVVVLVPLGSCEQHGPHLPLDTDTRIAHAVAAGCARRMTDVAVAPTLAYGASGEHQAFAGTLSIGTDALSHVLVELGRSARPDTRSPGPALVFVNGHGGNVRAVTDAVTTLRGEGRDVSAWAASVPGGDAHAGRTETSLLLAIAPELVRAARPVGAIEPLEAIAERLRADGVRAVSETGVLGDSTRASADEGRRILHDLVESLAEHVSSVLAGRHP